MSTTVDTWQEFARVTIQHNDLDPTYEMLYKLRAVKGNDWVSRFCLHMLMFYHVGEAEVAAQHEGRQFWEYTRDRYDLTQRGTERRHFRGAAGKASLESLALAAPYRPEDLLQRLARPAYPALYRAFDELGLKGFGAYFRWKAADYLDRVFGHRMSYDEAWRFLPEEPAKCAKLLFPSMSLKQALNTVADHISALPAPPNGDRPCGIPEAETSLCMVKGYFFTKSHVIGDDIADKYKALRGSELAQYLPSPVPRSAYVRGALRV